MRYIWVRDFVPSTALVEVAKCLAPLNIKKVLVPETLTKVYGTKCIPTYMYSAMYRRCVITSLLQGKNVQWVVVRNSISSLLGVLVR